MPAPTPFVTGTSAFGFKYKGGTILVADSALTYGKMHLTTNYTRITKLTDSAAVVFSGDEADMRDALIAVYEQIKLCRCRDMPLPTAKAIHGLLARQNYEKRNDQEPYLNNFIVAGPDFLGVVDLFGTNYETNFYASSLARYICMPLLRGHWNADISKDQAKDLAKLCIQVMRKNDCLAEKKYDVFFISDNGVERLKEEYQETFPLAGYRDLPQFV